MSCMAARTASTFGVSLANRSAGNAAASVSASVTVAENWVPWDQVVVQDFVELACAMVAVVLLAISIATAW